MRWIVALFLVLAPPAAAAGFDGPAKARVERVIDGDTVKMRVAIWLDQEILVSVRLAGVDAPELFRPKCDAERARALKAKNFVEVFLSGGEARLEDIEQGKYAGRVVARIEANGADLARALTAAGLAVSGGRKDWCASAALNRPGS
ncbi:thermonuclease family protein [Hyphococcus luteus]|uniref:Nuclease n=1 Tax=Hyphococcus luteus TaxID=2058213 RepID=A0A2S7K5X2_9PROT|nr:thermonuclease family protein [Marinicaulis flavus]PQA87903.1 nuclease [Marinicaulis flavus]